VLDCLDPAALSDFYVRFLGWKKGYDTGDVIMIVFWTGVIDIGFQRYPDYIPTK